MKEKIVLKFGGTSVSTPEMMRQAIQIVKERNKTYQVLVVVSALGGVTNQLIQLAELASKRSQKWLDLFEDLVNRHQSQSQLMCSVYPDSMIELFDELKKTLYAIEQKQSLNAKLLDKTMSFGERLSVRMFACGLQLNGVESIFVDTESLIKTDSTFGEAKVDLEKSSANLKEIVTSLVEIPVFTGFIGSDSYGNTTTLGRSGSDFTAGLVGYSTDAKWVEIWTDVDGVFTTDPNLVDQAVLIPELTYEFMEIMADNGAKVLHPRTVRPLQLKHIPIVIKNTFNPNSEGTWIRMDESKQVKNESNKSIINASLRKNLWFISVSEIEEHRVDLTDELWDLLETKALQTQLFSGLTGFVINKEPHDRLSFQKASQITVLTNKELYKSQLNEILEQLSIYQIKIFGFAFEDQTHISFFVEERYGLEGLKIIHKHYCL